MTTPNPIEDLPVGGSEATCKPVTVLHLTDLHFGWDQAQNENQEAQRKICLNDLLRVLRSLADSTWKPDLVLISGDLGWKGIEEDYDKALPWLKKIIDTCKIGFDKIVIAPGNHDSDRHISTQFGNLNDAEEADKQLGTPLADKLRSKAFQHFENFLKRNNIPALSLGNNETRLAGVVDLEGVRVLVLNSAWCARGDKDKGYLWIGLPQLEVMKAKEQIQPIKNNAPLTIALMHHPFEWLHEEELDGRQNRVGAKEFLTSHCHILLTGHTHKQTYTRPSQLDMGCIHFPGGATYAGSQHFNCIRLLQIADNVCNHRTWKFDPGRATEQWVEADKDSFEIPHLGKAPRR